MRTALVSIIIPCYNAEPWLAATLDSAFAQSWPSTEVILVDDGSTDDSVSLARTFEQRGLRIIQQSNRGASAARNAGLAAANGDYIQFLDADDLLGPRKIELQLARLQAEGGEVLSSSAWARFFDDPASAAFQPEENWRDLTGVEFLQLHYEQLAMMQPAAWLTPRAILDRAGPWNETLSLNDDGEYFARVMLTASRIVFVRDAQTFYRTGTQSSLSNRKDSKALESLYRSVELTTSHLLSKDRSERTLNAVAFAWKWAAFELYPDAPELSSEAERRCKELGGSRRDLPAGKRFQLLARLAGWRMARRLTR